MFSWFRWGRKDCKNILVLGNSGSGKKSFIYRYKDDSYSDTHFSFPKKSIDVLQHWENPDEKVQLHFVVDRSPDPQHSYRKTKKLQCDLILILIDLSSSEWRSDIDWYSQHAQIHYPGTKQFVIGTRADMKLPSNDDFGFLETSAKTGEGFEVFREQIKDAIRGEHNLKNYL